MLIARWPHTAGVSMGLEYHYTLFRLRSVPPCIPTCAGYGIVRMLNLGDVPWSKSPTPTSTSRRLCTNELCAVSALLSFEENGFFLRNSDPQRIVLTPLCTLESLYFYFLFFIFPARGTCCRFDPESGMFKNDFVRKILRLASRMSQRPFVDSTERILGPSAHPRLSVTSVPSAVSRKTFTLYLTFGGPTTHPRVTRVTHEHSSR